MSRAVLTLSLESNSDGAGPRTSGRAKTILRQAGFHQAGTSTWECAEPKATVVMRALERLSKLVRETDAARVDHLWFVMD